MDGNCQRAALERAARERADEMWQAEADSEISPFLYSERLRVAASGRELCAGIGAGNRPTRWLVGSTGIRLRSLERGTVRVPLLLLHPDRPGTEGESSRVRIRLGVVCQEQRSVFLAYGLWLVWHCIFVLFARRLPARPPVHVRTVERMGAIEDQQRAVRALHVAIGPLASLCRATVEPICTQTNGCRFERR